MSRRSRSSAGCPARLVPDNLKTGVDRPDLYDPKINRAYAELAAHYGVPGRPGPGAQAEGQAAGRAADAVCAGLVLAGPGVHLAGADAGRGADLVPRGRRPPARAGRWTGRPRPRCSPRSRPQALQPLPAEPFVLATLVDREGRPGHPRQGRQGALLGAVAADRPAASTPASTATMVQIFHHGQLVKTHPRKDRGKQTDSATTRRRRSPSTCAPRPGAARQAAEVGPACAAVIDELLADNALLPAARRPRRARPGRQARRRPGSRPPAPRPSRSGTRPTAPSRASSPPAPNTDPEPAAAGDGGAAAYLHGPDAVRHRHPRPPGTITSDDRARRRRRPQEARHDHRSTPPCATRCAP